MTTSKAGFSTLSLTTDRLVAGDMELVSRAITILSGQNLVRGTLLGKTAVSATVAAAVADAGNTGNGVFGTATANANVKNGRYRVVFVEPAANLGNFVVTDPGGIEVGQGKVGTAFAGPIGFTIADGATDFASGDGFSVDVSAAAFKYLKSVPTATDGSEVPDLILALDTDATSADLASVGYATGIFDDSAVTYGAGHTAASTREGLRRLGIHLIPTVGA